MRLEVYRIGYAPALALDGQAFGSTLVAGRWHSLGVGGVARRVVYAASSRALAQLEKRVQANGVTPAGQALFRLALPDGVVPMLWVDPTWPGVPPASATGTSSAPDLVLTSGWHRDIDYTRRIGDAWLDAKAALAVYVPSVVEPYEYNLLINPDHRLADGIDLVVERDPFVFDPRLGP